MSTALHEAVAARAMRGGMPIGAEGVAYIDQLLAEQRHEITRGVPPLACARAGEAVGIPTARLASPGDGGRAA